MNFPSNKDAQRVIAFTGAYVALRGALASYFVEFFTYGWFGMGALVFGVFMMMAWSLIKKYFEGVLEYKTMDKLFDILTGKTYVTPAGLLELLASTPNPYTVIKSHLSDLKNFLVANGYDQLANEIVRIINKYQHDPKKKGSKVRDELRKLASQYRK